jgi:hypothetical protein
MQLVICAIFRDEALYLREWIEFHRMVGVERFFLYQNNSKDEWQSVLQPFQQQGIVEVIDWPIPPPCQLQAYQHFVDRFRSQPWWAAFLDCDEFLFSPSHATVGEALATIPIQQCSAVGVNWMCFGASGHKTRTEGLVIERFTERPADQFDPNRHIKSIVRLQEIEQILGTPHWFDLRRGTIGEDGVLLRGPLSSKPQHSLLRINHYHTKSREEYLRRIARGRADHTEHRSPEEFDAYQMREVHDTSILRFLPELCERMR